MTGLCPTEQTSRRDHAYDGCMLTTIVIVLLALWLLGYATAYTAGGLIHVLLVVAVIVVLVRVIQGRNALRG